MVYPLQIIISSLTTTLVFVILLTKSYYILRTKQQRCGGHNRYRICGIFWFFVASLFLTLLSCFNIFGNYLHLVHSNEIFHVFIYRGAWTAWSIAAIYCYRTLLYGLNNFNGSIFKISMKSKLIMSILIISFFSLECLSTLCYVLYFFDIFDLKRYEMYHLVILILQEIVDFILTAGLIQIFIKTLMAVTVSVNDTMSISDEEIMNQDSFINLIAKYNLLGIPAVLSTQIFLFCDLLGIIIVLWTENAQFEVIVDTHFLPFMWTLECISNVLFLFLSASDATYWYHAMCNKCHEKSKRKILNKAQNKIYHKNITMMSLKQSLLQQ